MNEVHYIYEIVLRDVDALSDPPDTVTFRPIGDVLSIETKVGKSGETKEFFVSMTAFHRMVEAIK